MAIWTSPAQVQAGDWKWIVPSSGIAEGPFVTDPDSSFGMPSYPPNTRKEVSNYGLGAAFATTAGIYGWGHITHSERSRETGVLTTETMIDVLPLQFAIRGITGRERP